MIFTHAAICNKFVDLDLPKNSDVYVLVSSLLPIRGLSWTPYTSRLGYSNFITNCVEFVFLFSMIFTHAAFVIKLLTLT